MIKDKIVLDIETKNAFADVGGQQNLEQLDMSFVGAYSYNQDRYFSFHEKDFAQLGPLLQNAGLIITFAGKRFDFPILKKYLKFNLFALPHLDLLEEIELAYGQRIGLDLLAQTNLGIGKTGHGLDAIKYYKEGNLQALEDYCLQDVKVTKDLYEFIKKNGHVKIPKKLTNEITTVSLIINEFEQPATLF